MAKRSRRYQESRTAVADRTELEPAEAVEALFSTQAANFDETVEIVLKLGVDPRKADQLVRGSFVLPHGTGKEVRVIAFATGDQATAAQEAGAIKVGAKDLADEIEAGWMDFDVAIADRSLMRIVGKLGRILGPKGLMPSPKSGTVTEDVARAVKEFRAGKIEYRTDNGANVHAPVGKRSFTKEKLTDNVVAFMEHIRQSRPAAAKGAFIQKVFISSTMSPSVRVAPPRGR